MWDEIKSEIAAVANRQYYPGDIQKTVSQQGLVIKDILRQFIAGVMSMYTDTRSPS